MNKSQDLLVIVANYLTKKRFIRAMLSALLFILAAFFYYQEAEKLRHTFHVSFLDVGQGDSALIQFADGQTMLVDCGANRAVLAEIGKALPFYVRTIDVVLATHPDRDHYGGCADVLERYDVKKIVTNGRAKPYDPYWQEWSRAINAEGAEVVTMATPTVWVVANNKLDFLSPDPALDLKVPADDSNNYSIVFKLSNGDKSFLFTGDMETPLENAIIKKYCGEQKPCSTLSATVLKVGHHGSGSGTSDDFAAAVRPAQAIISVGKNNSYGHPAPRVIKHLERAGAQIMRTDQAGAITVF